MMIQRTRRIRLPRSGLDVRRLRCLPVDRIALVLRISGIKSKRAQFYILEWVMISRPYYYSRSEQYLTS